MNRPSSITTADGITTVCDPRSGLTIRGRSIAEIKAERRRLASSRTHARAIERWEGEEGACAREVAA